MKDLYHSFALSEVGFGTELGPEDFLDEDSKVDGFRITANQAGAAIYRDFEFENAVETETLMLVKAGIKLSVDHLSLYGYCELLAASWREIVIILQHAADPESRRESDAEIFREYESMTNEELQSQIDGACAVIRRMR